MSVNVKKVANRRPVRYESLDDFLHDADKLGKGPVRTLGNKSYPQILEHLAFAINGSIDGSPLLIPWPIRTVARLLRKRILNTRMSPGFKLSRANDAKAWLEHDADLRAALESVHRAVQRFESETRRSPHPAFGHLTPEEWCKFHLRHSEMHMSFVVPA
jgi:hypothetical protein